MAIMLIEWMVWRILVEDVKVPPYYLPKSYVEYGEDWRFDHDDCHLPEIQASILNTSAPVHSIPSIMGNILG